MNVLTWTLAAANPVGHVTDKPIYGQWLISNVTVMLVLSGLLTLLLIIPAAKKITSGRAGNLEDLQTRGTAANLVEAICLYLRDEVFRPVLHEQTDKYVPVLWTFFWFILISNLLGLVPLVDLLAAIGINEYHDSYVGIGGTATQSIWVTGTLAAIAFVWFNGTALLKDPIGFAKHLTAGAPMYMWPIMIPVEIIGTFVKPFALALRLFANMTGGHIIVATLLSFVVALATGLGDVAGHGLAIIPLLGTIAIYFLEVLVAFIQAYIFSFLTCLFLGQLVVHAHEGEHPPHDEAHEYLPHATPEGVDQTKSVPLGQSNVPG